MSADTGAASEFDEDRVTRYVDANPQASTVGVMGALLIDPAKRDRVEQLTDERGTNE